MASYIRPGYVPTNSKMDAVMGGGGIATGGRGGSSRGASSTLPTNDRSRVIQASVENSANPNGPQAPSKTQAANWIGDPPVWGQGNNGSANNPNPSGSAGSAGSPTNIDGSSGLYGYTGAAYGGTSGGGSHAGGPAWVDNGITIPTSTGGFSAPHWIQLNPDTGKRQTFAVGGALDDPARRAEAEGKVTGYGMTEEALGLQKNLEAFANLSAEIRKLGISSDTIKAAEKRLAGFFAGDKSYLNDPSFKAQTDFVTEQMARKLSPYGYAPGENSYGDNTIAQTIGSMANDWTKWWVGQNVDILKMGNDYGLVGAKGQLDAANAFIENNPQGLYAAAGVTTANSARDPLQAWNDWLRKQGDWTKKFPSITNPGP